MNYLVAVLSNQTQAEAAYSALEKEGLPSNKEPNRSKLRGIEMASSDRLRS